MMLALLFAAGLTIGAAGVWLLQREELRYLRKELAIAQDRLLHAWRDDKAIIPPRPSEPVPPPPPLPQELLDCVNEWEDPVARATEEARLRDWFFNRGLNIMSILRLREETHV